MTLINLVPIEELSDQHAFNEWKELPRLAGVVHRSVQRIENIPETFRLGDGHQIFFFNKGPYLEARHKALTALVKRRGYNITEHPPFKMPERYGRIDWQPSKAEIELSRQRIADRLAAKPEFYTWNKVHLLLEECA